MVGRMISYSLKCTNDHRFDSWFQSADAFDKLHKSGMVACTICGSTDVAKTLMAPQVQVSRNKPERPLSAEKTPAEQALSELRRKIEENSDYVGSKFAQEARDIHAGLSKERSIYGEAKPEEAKQLIDEGVPIVPLPFSPNRKTN